MEERVVTAFKDQRQRWTRVTAQCEPGNGELDRQEQAAAYFCVSFFRVEWEKHSSLCSYRLDYEERKEILLFIHHMYMYKLLYTHSYIYTHICRLYVYIDKHIHVHIHTYMHVYTGIHIHMYIHTHAHRYTEVHIGIHTHTYMHAHMYIHTGTRAHR